MAKTLACLQGRCYRCSAKGCDCPCHKIRVEARQDGTKPRAPSAVAADYAKALQARKGEDDTLRSLAVTQEVERLDGLLRAVETVRRTAARDGDQGMVLKAADRVLRIMERRAALLDLDLKGKDVPVVVEDELAKIRKRVHAEHPRQGGRRRGIS